MGNSNLHISVLALALIIKASKANGVWQAEDSAHKFLTQRLALKGSYNTNRKYLNHLLQIGAFKKDGKNLQLKNRDEVAELLNLDHTFNKDYYLNQHFIRLHDLKSMSVTNVRQLLLKQAVKRSLLKQKHKANKTRNFLDECKNVLGWGNGKRTKSRLESVKIVSKQARKHKLKTDVFAKGALHSEEMFRKAQVVTGCYFLADKFGVSHTTINNILNSLQKEGMYQRIVCQEKIETEISPDIFSLLTDVYKGKGVIKSNNNDGYIITIGSRLIFPEWWEEELL